MSYWLQRQIAFKPMSQGFHLITQQIIDALPEMAHVETGLLHLLLMHTSASLTINENADPDVRHDLYQFLERTVPGNEPYFRHVLEGADDMPAHIKSSLLGAQLTLPVSGGELSLGTWQGIYLGEHRKHGGTRRIMATLWGQSQ